MTSKYIDVGYRREMKAAKDQGSSRLQTSQAEAAYSVKGTVYNS